jgi:hypothetical protein
VAAVAGLPLGEGVAGDIDPHVEELHQRLGGELADHQLLDVRRQPLQDLGEALAASDRVLEGARRGDAHLLERVGQAEHRLHAQLVRAVDLVDHAVAFAGDLTRRRLVDQHLGVGVLLRARVPLVERTQLPITVELDQLDPLA